VAKLVSEKPLRQALPDGITIFIATQVEKEIRINEHRIRCRGGETPDEQIDLVSKAFTKQMEISEWVGRDGAIHLQCTRTAFTPIRFMLQLGMIPEVVDSWQVANGNRSQQAPSIVRNLPQSYLESESH
jgi:hypothetical protein